MNAQLEVDVNYWSLPLNLITNRVRQFLKYLLNTIFEKLYQVIDSSSFNYMSLFIVVVIFVEHV